MTSYYVNSNSTGNDSSDGKTPGTPFLTLAHAAGVVAAGDTVYVMKGIGYGGGSSGSSVLSLTVSGSAAAGYITWRNYPGDRPIFNTSRGRGVINIFANYIIVSGFEVVGANGAITTASAMTNANIASTGWQTDQLFNGSGILSDDNGTSFNLTTNAVTTATTVLHFASGGAAATAGMVVTDLTTPASIPTGTTVVSSTATSVTLSATVTVASGDSIRFLGAHHHIQVLNCWVHDFGGNGIALNYCDYKTCNNNVIWNCGLYSPFGNSGMSLFFCCDVDTTGNINRTFVQNNIVFGCQNIVGDNSTGRAQLTSNATTAAGNAVLHFASTTGIAVGMLCYDITTPAAIPNRATVLSFVANTSVTLSANALSPGVGASDTFLFATVTDGEGIILDTNNQQPAYTGRSLVTNNVCFNNGSNGIEVFASNHVDLWYNSTYLNYFDTAVQASNTGELGIASAADCTLANNVLSARATVPVIGVGSGVTSTTYSTNLGFGGNGTALPGSGNISAQDPLYYAPVLTYDPNSPPVIPGFMLKPSSPAISVANATYAATTDIRGSARPAGALNDLGAYENQTGGLYGSTFRTMAYIMANDLQDGQAAGSITAAKVREAVIAAFENSPGSW